MGQDLLGNLPAHGNNIPCQMSAGHPRKDMSGKRSGPETPAGGCGRLSAGSCGRRASRLLLFCFLPFAFLCALLWAHAKDPFIRTYFAVKGAGGKEVRGLVIRPKAISKGPVVIYLHDANEVMEKRGVKMRQLAELGLMAVNFDYSGADPAAFGADFAALLEYLKRQGWQEGEGVACFGYGLGAQRILEHSVGNAAFHPQWMALLGGAKLPESMLSRPGPLLPCPVLLVHGRNDAAYPFVECERIAALLESQGVPVTLHILEEYAHRFDRNEDLINRVIAERCAAHFRRDGRSCLNGERSGWLFLLPVFAAGALGLAWGWSRLLQACRPDRASSRWLHRGLRGITVCIGLVACGQTCLQLVLPRLAISETTLALGRTHLVRPAWKEDYDFLAQDAGWAGKPIRELLNHVELADLQRTQFYPALDKNIYRDFVLSPRTGENAPAWNWRRPLWDAFYPRIRKIKNPVEGARVAVRFLRERVTISAQVRPPADIISSWTDGIADGPHFNELYVAVLRSVGIAAQQNNSGGVEIWTGQKWVAAPRPFLETGFRPAETAGEETL